MVVLPYQSHSVYKNVKTLNLIDIVIVEFEEKTWPYIYILGLAVKATTTVCKVKKTRQLEYTEFNTIAKSNIML